MDDKLKRLEKERDAALAARDKADLDYGKRLDKLKRELVAARKEVTDLKDYKRQWSKAKFEKILADVTAKEHELIRVKGKFEADLVFAVENAKREVNEQLLATQAEIEFHKKQHAAAREELEQLYSRVEELELMVSTDRLEARELQRQQRVRIDFKEREISELEAKVEATKVELQSYYRKEIIRVEGAYRQKEQWYLDEIRVLREEEQHKAAIKLRELEETTSEEIKRLTVLINVYKEKLARKEAANRDLVVANKMMKEEYELRYSEMKEEMESLRAKIKTLTLELENIEKSFRMQIEELERQIRDLKAQLERLRAEKGELTLTIDRLNVKIKELEITIVQLRGEISQYTITIESQRVEIEALKKRGPKVVKEYIERTVTKQESDVEEEKQVDEEIQETFEVVERQQVTSLGGRFDELGGENPADRKP